MLTGQASRELRATVSVSLIMAVRMLGLFMILPIFSVQGLQYDGATVASVGLALGIYGLTQACCQIPFGWASDYFGRKPIITLGLAIFAIGSAVAATSHTIWGIVLGRAVQGSGAIGSTCMALLADTTREQHRTKAMAVVGMSIGLSFALSLILAPSIQSWFGMSGLFWCMTGLTPLALLILWLAVPPAMASHHNPTKPHLRDLLAVAKNPLCSPLLFSIACLHAVITALFLILPAVLQQRLQWPHSHQWQFYIPIMIFAFLAMLPCILLAERHGHVRAALMGCVLCLGLGSWAIYRPLLTNDTYSVIAGTWLFFTGFNALEAILPSLMSRSAPLELKGAAMGLFSTCQFMGIFLGGVGAGWAQQHVHGGAEAFILLLLAIWLLILGLMRAIPLWSTLVVTLPSCAPAQQKALQVRIAKLACVQASAFNWNSGIANLKIDTKIDNKHCAKRAIDQIINTQESPHGQRHQ